MPAPTTEEDEDDLSASIDAACGEITSSQEHSLLTQPGYLNSSQASYDAVSVSSWHGEPSSPSKDYHPSEEVLFSPATTGSHHASAEHVVEGVPSLTCSLADPPPSLSSEFGESDCAAEASFTPSMGFHQASAEDEAEDATRLVCALANALSSISSEDSGDYVIEINLQVDSEELEDLPYQSMDLLKDFLGYPSSGDAVGTSVLEAGCSDIPVRGVAVKWPANLANIIAQFYANPDMRLQDAKIMKIAAMKGTAFGPLSWQGHGTTRRKLRDHLQG